MTREEARELFTGIIAKIRLNSVHATIAMADQLTTVLDFYEDTLTEDANVIRDLEQELFNLTKNGDE